MLRPVFIAVDESYSDFRAAKAEWSKRILRPAAEASGRFRAFSAIATPSPEQNVVGIGVDEKFVAGVPTGVTCLKFLVRKKFALNDLNSKQTIPARVAGLPTDVEEVGTLVPYARRRSGTQPRTKSAPKAMPTARASGVGEAAFPNPRKKLRPAQPGSSVGFRDPADAFVMAGTFGLLVQDAAGVRYVLSNNHVLANENRLAAGSPVFQPGLLDNGNTSSDQIAELTRFVRLDPTEPGKVDGAIAKLVKSGAAKSDILFIGPPRGASAAARDMVVHKFGRTTSYTAGRVSSIDFDVNIPYDVGTVTFEDQVAVRGLNGQRFSDQGDSGSAIVERTTGNVIGLLFGGRTDGTLTFANHISDVLTALDVSLV